MSVALKAGAELPLAGDIRVVPKHHWLVRVTHWLNVPLLLGLGMSGISIYWASPVLTHKVDSYGETDYLADIGDWLSKNTAIDITSPPSWFYNHFSLGTGALAEALRLHWLLAYLFMLNGFLYLVGLIAGKGYKALLPRKSDIMGVVRMLAYYATALPAALRKVQHPHPIFHGKYNSLQRLAYFSMPILGLLEVATGWAIHKPQQLGWLAALFGGYNWARVWHFWIMWAFLAFVIPHILLVATDGWDTFRSMVVGWSDRVDGVHPRSVVPAKLTVEPATEFPGLKDD